MTSFFFFNIKMMTYWMEPNKLELTLQIHDSNYEHDHNELT